MENISKYNQFKIPIFELVQIKALEKKSLIFDFTQNKRKCSKNNINYFRFEKKMMNDIFQLINE